MEEGVFLPPPFPASGQSYLQNSLHSSEETSSLGVMDTDRIPDWHTGCHGDVAKQGGRADERGESLALFLFWEVRVGKKDFQGQLRSCSTRVVCVSLSFHVVVSMVAGKFPLPFLVVN